jgi:hypothetical protein
MESSATGYANLAIGDPTGRASLQWTRRKIGAEQPNQPGVIRSQPRAANSDSDLHAESKSCHGSSIDHPR